MSASTTSEKDCRNHVDGESSGLLEMQLNWVTLVKTRIAQYQAGRLVSFGLPQTCNPDTPDAD